MLCIYTGTVQERSCPVQIMVPLHADLANAKLPSPSPFEEPKTLSDFKCLASAIRLSQLMQQTCTTYTCTLQK